MESETSDRISRRAYEIWESEGRPEGRHHDHWIEAKRELAWPAHKGEDDTSVPFPGMMGDGNEEQNLGQPGRPGARISEDEVREAFAGTPETEGA